MSVVRIPFPRTQGEGMRGRLRDYPSTLSSVIGIFRTRTPVA
ncbi:hypothetical protein SAMN04488125_11781 [Methylorubrum salsuginis]|uniref:Uncharacterized protein n=1 Tax=Methylorubrum salsuginis TaxID=414703 RepID=A0A1I4IHL1_9HYPH|nr:hypothetical protein SAMN04488125_11781 [Methylorubrum salsuginis]